MVICEQFCPVNPGQHSGIQLFMPSHISSGFYWLRQTILSWCAIEDSNTISSVHRRFFCLINYTRSLQEINTYFPIHHIMNFGHTLGEDP